MVKDREHIFHVRSVSASACILDRGREPIEVSGVARRQPKSHRACILKLLSRQLGYEQSACVIEPLHSFVKVIASALLAEPSD